MNPLSPKYKHRRHSVFTDIAVCAFFAIFPIHATPPVAYDIDRAKEICDSIPLSPLEGVWKYPEDNVTVLVVRDIEPSATEFQTYSITVVETTDCRLHPGDKIGILTATPEADKFSLKLFTERKHGILSKPETCLASLGKDRESLILKGKKSKFRLRLSSNLSALLPKTWRVIRIGVSGSPESSKENPTAGMVKIYPSYDGNGSSRRTPRYL